MVNQKRRYVKAAVIATLATALLLWLAGPTNAATKNACYVQTLRGGQFVTQTAGVAGAISVYVDGVYATSTFSLSQPYYATSSKTAVVRGYDQNGMVC